MKSVSFRVKHPAFFSVAFFLIGLVLLLAGLGSFALLETRQYVLALQNFDAQAADIHARRARYVVTAFSAITLQQNNDIEAWKLALSFSDNLLELESLVTKLSASLAQSGETLNLIEVAQPLESIEVKVTQLQKYIDASFFAKKLISQKKQQQLALAAQALSDLTPFLEKLSTGKQTWVILLQNSDELRATGGFPGSYAFVSFNEGSLEEIIIEDIYDADGQFAGFVEAPAGIREYTSSSRGLRLPDANWYPHYPKSAETMLQFFALGNKRMIAGITSINLSVGSSVLEATGPIFLPDYGNTVTADNIHIVLREGRDEFFPGSIQKKHILTQTTTLVRQKIAELPPDKQLQLLQKLFTHMATKDIQAFAVQPELQAIFEKYGITGKVGVQSQLTNLTNQPCDTTQCEPTIFYLVESNVGINKANRYIQRTVQLTQNPDNQIKVTIDFTNNAPKESKTLLTPAVGQVGNPRLTLATNGYANYQRLLISDRYRLKQVLIDGKKEEKIDSEVLSYDEAGEINQYGFLVVTLPEQKTSVELTLEPRDSTMTTAQYPFLIQKQSGVQPPLYTLNSLTQPISFTLERDTLVSWK